VVRVVLAVTARSDINIAKCRCRPESRVLGTPRPDIHGTYEEGKERERGSGTVVLPLLVFLRCGAEQAV
jgi:hypothetical protein